MKEAAGEANMTVITIVLITIVLGVGTLIVTNLMNNTQKSSACQTAAGVWKGGRCCEDDTCAATLECKKATVAGDGVEKGDWTCEKK